MPTDLHQPGLARRAVWVVLALLAGALGPSSLAGPAAGQSDDASAAPSRETPRGPTPCAIDGRAAVPGVSVTRTRRGRTRVARIDLPAREIRLEVLSPSSFHVTTREGEPVIDGHVQTLPPISLRTDRHLGGVTARRGARVVRVSPREQSLDVDVDLGASVHLRRLAIACESLRVHEAAPTAEPMLDAGHPQWTPRGRELSVRDRAEEGIELARLAVVSELRLTEVARDDGFVHVRVGLPFGAIDGWVRDSALVPAR